MKALLYAAVLIAVSVPIVAAELPNGNVPWTDYLIPLPHEIAVSNTVRIAPDQISFTTPADASSMVTQAVAELRAAWQVKSGCVPNGTAFTVTIGKLSDNGQLNGKPVEGAMQIKKVKYPDQAYLIRPLGSNGLVVAAWNDKGVFYGIQTLTQLLTAKLTKTEAIVPLAVITDWPDMDERGTWNVGYRTPGFIPWMAAIKLNFTHAPMMIILKKDAPAECPKLPMDLIHQADERAFHLVPHITHYDYWHRCGVTNLYPELVGKGDSAVNPQAKAYPNNPKQFELCRCPCASNPKFTELVTDWVRSATAQGARELSLWLTEFAPCQCECEKCMKNGRKQFQLETRASIDALQTVQKQHPDLVGRIFFTLGGGPGNHVEEDTQNSAECLAIMPRRGIKAEKVYSRNKAFDDYAAKGNWVATYSGPNLVAGGVFRFGCAGAMLSRINVYFTNHYSALYCIGCCPTPETVKGDFEKTFGGYQLNALAEWTWNVKGRDQSAFAKAWATRQGFQNPGQFAAWVAIMEPLEIRAGDLRGSAVDIWDKSLTALSARQPLPDNFTKPELLTNYLAGCERAIPMAKDCGDQSVMEETLMLKSFFQAFAQLADLHKQITQAKDQPVDRASIEQALKAIRDSLAESARHLESMMSLLGVDPKAGPDVVIAGFNKQVKTMTDRLNLFNP